MDPLASFATDDYRRHNSRRLEHLATLGLDLAGRKVLEVGAGIGDHTSFFSVEAAWSRRWRAGLKTSGY